MKKGLSWGRAEKLASNGYPHVIYFYCDTRKMGNAPGLTDLIEECLKLAETKDFHLELNSDNTWGASVDCFKDEEYIQGTTPEDAVANLWVHLNRTKKKQP